MPCPDCDGKFRWKCHDKVMSDEELAKYMKDIKKHTKKVCNAL